MKIGIVFGAFDLLHTGHILMLKECKENCDYLIVGLHIDPSIERKEKNKPIETTFERYIKLKAIKYIDEIIPYDTEEDLENMLKTIQPDIRFIGKDWKNKKITGEKKNIYWIERKHNYSSTNLRKRIKRNVL